MEAMRSKIKGMFWPAEKSSISGRGNETVDEWEIRPGGMLVQKRNPEPDQESLHKPTIRVKVKYGSSHHQIHISPQASFGELKKLLAEKIGLHPDDQKILYKKKERSSKAFLDIERVKDGSKLVLVEDSTSREKRCLEMFKIANLERAKRSLSDISLQIDKFAQRVEELKKMDYQGGKIAEAETDNITGKLMSELVRLDELLVQGDLKLQKINLEKRAQNNIEMLDKLKLNKSKTKNKKVTMQKKEEFGGHKPILKQENMQEKKKKQIRSPTFMVSSKWETFD